MITTDLRLLSDKELWVLKKSGNAIPFYMQVVAHPEIGEDPLFMVSFPIMKPHVTAYAKRVFEGVAVYKTYSLMFVQSFESIQSLIEKAPGVTPEYYLSFREEDIGRFYERPICEDIVPVIDGVDEEFLREIVQRTHVSTLAGMKMIFRAIVNTAMNRLINEQKPINLGFCTLFAVPYRSNWKSILLGAFPKAWAILSMPKAEVEKTAIQAGLADAFFWKELLEIKSLRTRKDKHVGNHICGWKLECVPNKTWRTAVEHVEKIRHTSSSEGYAKHIAKSIKRNVRLILDAFSHFVQGAVAPSASFSSVGYGGRQILIPYTPKGRISPTFALGGSADVCADSSLDHRNPSLGSAIEKEIADVLAVSDAEQEVPKLRYAWGDVEKPGERKT